MSAIEWEFEHSLAFAFWDEEELSPGTTTIEPVLWCPGASTIEACMP